MKIIILYDHNYIQMIMKLFFREKVSLFEVIELENIINEYKSTGQLVN